MKTEKGLGTGVKGQGELDATADKASSQREGQVDRPPKPAGRGYEQLYAWQKAHVLALDAFKFSERIRQKDRWIASQLTRAALSVPLNIAEGYSRGTLRDYLRFLHIARGSLAEAEYLLTFIRDAGLSSNDLVGPLVNETRETAKVLQGLIRALQAKDPKLTDRMIREEPVTYDDGPVGLDP